MARITDISDKFFNRDDSAETLTEFTRKLTAAETLNSGVGLVLNIPSDFTVNTADVYRFLSDRGAGRIYDGLKSLELMSRTIRGIGISTARLFDNDIISHTADDIKNASPEYAIRIINANIGIQDVYDYAKLTGSKELAGYEAFASVIARQIKAGSFKTEDHIQEALVRVKSLIRSVLHTKRQR